MGFMRQNPPNFRRGGSTGAPRNRRGNLQGSQAGMMANMLRGRGADASQYRSQAQNRMNNLAGQRMAQSGPQSYGQPQANQMTKMPNMGRGGPENQQANQPTRANQMRAAQDARGVQPGGGGLGAIAQQQMGGPRPMPQQGAMPDLNQMQQMAAAQQNMQQGPQQMGGPRPMPQQAQLQGPGSMPQRPQMPQQMGGKGGRSPQPPGQAPQMRNFGPNNMGGQQRTGKGGRGQVPQQRPQQRTGKGGRGSVPWSGMGF